MRGGAAPSALPEMQALRPSKGDGVRLCLTLLPDEKVTKESPRGGHPLWGLPLGGIIIPPATQALLPPEKSATSGSLQEPNLSAAPRIDSRRCNPRCSLGRNKDRFAHPLKVANRSFVVAGSSPARCVGEREKGADFAPGDFKGRSPWRAFGDFPRDGKVTRVQGGAPAGGCRDCQSRKSPGCPTHPSVEREKREVQRGRQPPRKT